MPQAKLCHVGRRGLQSVFSERGVVDLPRSKRCLFEVHGGHEDFRTFGMFPRRIIGDLRKSALHQPKNDNASLEMLEEVNKSMQHRRPTLDTVQGRKHDCQSHQSQQGWYFYDFTLKSALIE